MGTPGRRTTRAVLAALSELRSLSGRLSCWELRLSEGVCRLSALSRSRSLAQPDERSAPPD